MLPKVKVFVSHSFDPNDQKDIELILAFLRQPKFHLEILTARSPEATRIGTKIERLVDWADVTFGIFTKRYRDNESDVWVPPPYVLTECGYAKGRYADNNTQKGVHGLVEVGIQHTDLGLMTVFGEEFPPFRREQFKRGDTRALESFLTTLQKRYGPAALHPPKRPYKQRELRKTVEILRNGTAVFKHTVTIGILDPRLVAKSGILHNLWAPRDAPDLPLLEDMSRVPLVKHHEHAFFSCACVKKNAETVNVPMKVSKLEQDTRTIRFRLSFPFELQSNDVLRYQYVWSLPRAFATCEEELNSRKYNELGLRTPHGPIGDAFLKLKFQRDTVHGASAELFGQKPFLLYSYTHNEDAFVTDEPTPVPLLEYDAMWEIYELHAHHLQNAILVRWQPSSRARVKETLRPAALTMAAPAVEVSAIARPRRPKQMARIRPKPAGARRRA